MIATVPVTMQATVQDEYGSTSVLRQSEAPVPTAGPGHVLVKVRAASINPADVFMMTGSPWMLRLNNGMFRPKQPIRGMDLAGEVVAVGEGVTRWKVGDSVCGQGDGTLAQYATSKEDWLTHLPEGVSFEHGATLAIAGVTAQIAMEVMALKPGERLLINGAAGGIGQFVVQLAKRQGIHVTAVCSGRNVERVRGLGADVVLDYGVDNVLDAPQPYDAVLDNAGSVRIRDWKKVTRRGGAILPNSGAQGPDGGAVRRVIKATLYNLVSPHRIKTFYAVVTTQRLERLAALVESGAVVPLIDSLYALEHAADAVEQVASHHARGKVVVAISS
jgi:NADPH:quinone reductase-like Zn-dependent oxidoreductase